MYVHISNNALIYLHALYSHCVMVTYCMPLPLPSVSQHMGWAVEDLQRHGLLHSDEGGTTEEEGASEEEGKEEEGEWNDGLSESREQ